MTRWFVESRLVTRVTSQTVTPSAHWTIIDKPYLVLVLVPGLLLALSCSCFFMLQCMDQTAARISDAASVSEHSASEATTLCEIDIQPDANTPCKSVTHKPEVSNYLASLETNNKERYNPFVIDNKYTTNSRRKPLKWVWSSISNWFADYRTWRRVWATCSQIELWRKYYPVNAQELQEAYEYWRALWVVGWSLEFISNFLSFIKEDMLAQGNLDS